LTPAQITLRGHRSGATHGQLARGERLHRADRAGAQRGTDSPPGRCVAEAGDLRLIGHDPHERQAVSGEHRARQRGPLLGSVDGRALGADAHASAEGPPAGIEIDAHAQRSGVAGAPRRLERAVD